MSRLRLEMPTLFERGTDLAAKQASKRLSVRPQDQCPVDFTRSLIHTYASESCGKCNPCRVGLTLANHLLEDIILGDADMEAYDKLVELATYIKDASDCVIGYESGHLLEQSLIQNKEDFISHIETGRCAQARSHYVPCQRACPAHVDVPAYIALVGAGRLQDALRVIRNDNPLPATCGYVCEHPCELSCRRTVVDDPINICMLKRYAADNAQDYDPMPCLESTGKKIAVVGSGPAGLTAAYYLQLMGHQVEIFEQREMLGGMCRYGIPDYRLPPAVLNSDINFILKTGIVTHLSTSIGKDISYDELIDTYDAIYLAIGAHNDKKLGIAGENSNGVVSAVEFLRRSNGYDAIDLAGKRVVVIGGGNVAMDCTRTAKRLGAKSVECVYRRRVKDMTALEEEIHDAFAEGCQITELQSPVRIESNDKGQVQALITQQQMVGEISGGRPRPIPLDNQFERIDCDVVIVAIGQNIDTSAFEHALDVHKGRIVADFFGSAKKNQPVYAGGDAVSGPATVIKAVAAGKIAAANIDAELGYHHDVYEQISIPDAQPNTLPIGRVELRNMRFTEAAKTFDLAKFGMQQQEAVQECSRCLRCDHYGFSAQFEGDRKSW